MSNSSLPIKIFDGDGMPPHWRVTEALAHEIDLAVSLAMSESLRPLFPTFATAVEALPPAWFARGREVSGGLAGDVFMVLGRLATVLGLARETDYATLTLALRDTTVAEVEAAARGMAQAERIALGEAASPLDVLVTVSDALQLRAGSTPNAEGTRRLRLECRVALSACRDGAAHSRFWFWLDQFQHEVYRPWRAGRAAFLVEERVRAVAALGGEEGDGVPRLDWLHPMSPVHAMTPVHEVVTAGEIALWFHVEPFGTWDVRGPLPGALLMTFGQPGELQAAFRARAEDIAGRLKALSDPTRLTMLRIVRGAEVDNSDLAAYLDLSHPTISVHARVLRDAALVESRREGRRLLHRVDPEGVRRLLREVESFLGLRLDDEPDAPSDP